MRTKERKGVFGEPLGKILKGGADERDMNRLGYGVLTLRRAFFDCFWSEPNWSDTYQRRGMMKQFIRSAYDNQGLNLRRTRDFFFDAALVGGLMVIPEHWEWLLAARGIAGAYVWHERERALDVHSR